MSRESGKTNVGPKWLVGAGLAALYTSLKARHDLLGNVAVNLLCDFLLLGSDVLHDVRAVSYVTSLLA